MDITIAFRKGSKHAPDFVEIVIAGIQRANRLPRQFARAAVRGLGAEQVYQSFLTATGFRPTSAPSGVRMALYGPATAAGQFLAKFHNPHEQPIEMQMSIQQALYLMNSGTITVRAQ